MRNVCIEITSEGRANATKITFHREKSMNLKFFEFFLIICHKRRTFLDRQMDISYTVSYEKG